MKTWLIALLSALAVCLATGQRAAAQTEAQPPDLSLISGNVSITAPTIELGRLLDYISERTGTAVLSDRRFRAVRLTVLGANGPAGELLDAVEAATGLQVRRLDNWYVLSPDRRGAAAVAHEYRRRGGRTLVADRALLSLKADAVARRGAMRFWSSISQAHLAGLPEEQRALFQRQGFLTVADLFPEYYQPMYDIFGNLVETTSERPASLPQFAGTRVFFYPNLQLLVHLPVRVVAEEKEPAAAQSQPLTWPIDLGGF